MIIMGVDPGIARCGWGIIEVKGQKLEAIKYGCIETSPKKQTPERLCEIYKQIEKAISTYSPEVVAVEELFFNTNAKTAFVVGQARGVILLAASQKNKSIFIYTPLQVKISLTGYGRAQKDQVSKMVKALLKLKEIPKLDDTTDALAIAICHAFSNKLK